MHTYSLFTLVHIHAFSTARGNSTHPVKHPVYLAITLFRKRYKHSHLLQLGLLYLSHLGQLHLHNIGYGLHISPVHTHIGTYGV